MEGRGVKIDGGGTGGLKGAPSLGQVASDP